MRAWPGSYYANILSNRQTILAFFESENQKMNLQNAKKKRPFLKNGKNEERKNENDGDEDEEERPRGCFCNCFRGIKNFSKNDSRDNEDEISNEDFEIVWKRIQERQSKFPYNWDDF